jgi:DNA invertase Pin-like site-specific DNA recombinase
MNCVSTGRMDSLQIGMHGVVGQMQREEGVKKVRRGLAGVIRDGRSAGGRAYGYRPKLGKPGELEVVEPEAAVIRRIFAAYELMRSVVSESWTKVTVSANFSASNTHLIQREPYDAA